MEHKERRIIAVCASWEDVENLNLMLNRLIRATEGRNYLPVCVPFDRSGIEARGEQSIREFLSAFELPNLAGILLLGEMIRSDDINGHLIRLAQAKKIPVFMMERRYEGCINLSLTYSEGFERVVRHMVEDHGCRDVVMVAGILGNSYSEERVDLCRSILEAHGGALPPEKVIYGDFWDDPTIRALDAYFAGGGAMPEAFICANDAMAIAVCIYLAEKNIQVPEQVKVAGFDGILPGEAHKPTITTASPDYLTIYTRMLDRIDAWQTEDSGRTEVWPIPYALCRRESCGCERMDPFKVTKKIGDLKIHNLHYTRHIRAMGYFIRSTLNMDSLEALKDILTPIYSMWNNPYHFAAVLAEQEKGFASPILHVVHGASTQEAAFPWEGMPVPDYRALCADPSVRIVMAQLLQNREETMGYLVAGMEEWTLQQQERFEEQAIFLSAALNAVISNKRLEAANREILQLAEHDYLTGLYNRRGFLRELENRLSAPESQALTLTLFSMDMDRLKGINDVYGHHEGDTAIQCLARGISAEVEGKGICARYGGDEFAFAMLTQDSLLGELEAIRARIEATAREHCGPRAYTIAASLGACASPVRDLASLDQLLAEADRALYADKLKRHPR